MRITADFLALEDLATRCFFADPERTRRVLREASDTAAAARVEDPALAVAAKNRVNTEAGTEERAQRVDAWVMSERKRRERTVEDKPNASLLLAKARKSAAGRAA